MVEVKVEREDLEFILEVLKSNVDDVGLAISIISKYLVREGNTLESKDKIKVEREVLESMLKVFKLFEELMCIRRMPGGEQVMNEKSIISMYMKFSDEIKLVTAHIARLLEEAK